MPCQLLERLFFIFVFLPSLIKPSFSSSHTCSDVENQSLLSLKQSLVDTDNVLSSWNAEASCCTWEGVVCSNRTGHVVHLNLGGSFLRGNFNPALLLNLEHLQRLDLSGNFFEETRLKLQEFHASGNHLTLKVSPNWIPPLNISSLRLGSWSLGSRIPSWLEPSIGLVHLDLSKAGIYGRVPNWLWTRSMTFLNLSHNQFHGNIPLLSSGSSTFLKSIFLSSNNFSGRLPQIGEGVRDLDFSDNSFSRDVSSFLCDTTTTDGLENLHLGGNHLNGELPDCFAKWSSLKSLNLGNNNFSGTIPNSMGLLSKLASLNLYGNNFSGHIPFSMHNCTQLVNINLADNNLHGNIPEWIGKSLSNLTILILRSNKLSGEIPSALCQQTSLQILDLSGNKLSGMIPSCVSNFTAMITQRIFHRFYYSSSYYSSSKAFRDNATIATKGKKLNYDTMLLLVTNIDLSNNDLSGDIPKEITSLVWLRSLNLSRNHFIGMIPESIGNMKQMESLDFSVNSLSGELPNSFGSMSFLNYLDVSFNYLTGRIPQSTQILGLKSSSFIGNSLCGPPLEISCSNDSTTQTEDQDQEEEEDESEEIVWLFVIISLGYAVGLSAFFTIWFLNASLRDACEVMLENLVNKHVHARQRRHTRASARNS